MSNKPIVRLTGAVTGKTAEQQQRNDELTKWLDSLSEGVKIDDAKLVGLVRVDGSICTACALANGAVWPEGHVATFSQGVCCICERETVTCAVSDWNFPDVKGRKAPREF